MSHTHHFGEPLRIMCAVSKLRLLNAWHEVSDVWHASTAHRGYHSAQGATRSQALDNLRGMLERHHRRPIELEII